MAQVKPVNKKKMSGPSLAASIIAIVILLGFIVSLLASGGVFVRAKKGASSDNFEINGAMMDYFANSYFQNWYSDYSEWLQENYIYVYMGYITAFDTSKPFDEQIYDSVTGKTYAEFFVEQSETYVTQILRYCEAAKADSEVDFAELEAEAQTYAEGSLESIEQVAKLSGMDAKGYIRAYYGENMNLNDFKKALVLEHIASDYASIVYDRVLENMTDERKVEYFKDNVGSFFTAGYLTLSLSNPEDVEYPVAEDYEGGEESKAYKAAKTAADKTETTDDDPVVEDYVGGAESKAYKAAYEEAEEAKLANDMQKITDKEIMDKLTTAKTADEFKRIILDYKYSDNFDSAYSSISSKLGDSKPSDEELNEFKASVKDKIIDAVIAGLSDISSAEESAEESEEEETEWEKNKKTLPASVITKLNSVITSATKTASYTLSTDLGNKLFGGVKGEYDIPYESYETQGTNAALNDVWYADALLANKSSIEIAIKTYEAQLKEEDADKETIQKNIDSLKESLEEAEQTIADAEKTGEYTYTAYFVTEAAHRDETILRDVGHILFKVDTSATATTSSSYKTEEEAKQAAEELLKKIKAEMVEGVITKEKFEEFAKDTHDSSIFYEDVTQGDMVDEFNDWLFAAKTVGEVGLVKTSYGYHIMYYGGETGVPAWKNDAHLAATDEDVNTWYEGLDYEVTVNAALFESVFN